MYFLYVLYDFSNGCTGGCRFLEHPLEVQPMLPEQKAFFVEEIGGAGF